MKTKFKTILSDKALDMLLFSREIKGIGETIGEYNSDLYDEVFIYKKIDNIIVFCGRTHELCECVFIFDDNKELIDFYISDQFEDASEQFKFIIRNFFNNALTISDKCNKNIRRLFGMFPEDFNLNGRIINVL